MKKYDFETTVDRRGTNSLKWDVADGELPMWVADMDFRTAPEITEAITERAAHGIFGYNIIPDEWYDAYRYWWGTRHGLDIPREWLIFCTGAIPAISTAVRKLTTPAEKVLVEVPIYNTFFNSIENNGRYPVMCPLIYEDGEYRRDFDALEAALSDPQVTLMILCNPHNPTGRIWSRSELARVGELCRAHHVTVISDEIHCDLTDPGFDYVPFASVSDVCREISVTCVAPTKAFNIAGMQSAAVIVPNEALRHKMWRGLNTDEVAEPNTFAVGVAIAAFTRGGQWLDELRAVIADNKQAVYDFMRRELPSVRPVISHATYLAWLDISSLTHDSVKFAAFVREKTGLFVSNGAQYRGHGHDFLRLNLACPRKTLDDGLARLKTAVKLWESIK